MVGLICHSSFGGGLAARFAKSGSAGLGNRASKVLEILQMW
jgi:hypothetical protein